MTEPAKLFDLTQPAAEPSLWPLDPTIAFLNHGSFGSCPRAVLEVQRQLRDRLERQPITFLVRELEGLLDQARTALAAFVGAEAEDLVFVPNATAGVNTVLRSLRFQPGDELLATDHGYNACNNALKFTAEQWGATAIVASIPFPLKNAGQVVEGVLSRVTARTRLVMLDHVTSPTGMILPIERLVRDLTGRGIEMLVDGAHAPGMLPLKLRELGAAYYTGNCHKWICAPKGAGFLHVRRDLQKSIRPLVISHGANSRRSDRSRFLIEFGWTGTADPTAALSIPEAIRFMGSLLPRGWPAIMQRNRALALGAQATLCDALNIPAPCPEEMMGALAAVPISDAADDTPPVSPLYLDPLQDRLLAKHGIEVPVAPWPAPPKRVLRISAQLYNSLPQYERLASALKKEFALKGAGD